MDINLRLSSSLPGTSREASQSVRHDDFLLGNPSAGFPSSAENTIFLTKKLLRLGFRGHISQAKAKRKILRKQPEVRLWVQILRYL